MARRSLVLLVALMGLAPAVYAADIQVSYRVDAKTLKLNTPAGTQITFQLYNDNSCATPIASEAVNIEDTTLIEQPKLIKVKNGPKPPQVAEISYTLTGVTPQAQTYAMITGPGITPIGGACQLQSASVGGVDTVTPPPPPCAVDSVRVGGPTGPCVDKYEASLWQIPPGATTVIQHVKDRTVTLAELTGAGATQVSVPTGWPTYECNPTIASLLPLGIPGDGTNLASVYAVSIPDVIPTACITGSQAEDACHFSGKRLLTSAEWVEAATGTPDLDADNGTTDCNTGSPPASISTAEPVVTGSRSGCVSSAGVFDMVGNVSEMTTWTFSSIWIRGGSWHDGWIGSTSQYATPSGANVTSTFVGFRCAR